MRKEYSLFYIKNLECITIVPASRIIIHLISLTVYQVFNDKDGKNYNDSNAYSGVNYNNDENTGN